MAKGEDRKKKKKRKSAAEPGPATVLTEEQAEDGATAELDASNVPDSTKPASEEFESWYLRKVTMELQDDLNKIRSAGDFKDSSLPILITALRQGESIFSTEEKTRIMTGDSRMMIDALRYCR